MFNTESHSHNLESGVATGISQPPPPSNDLVNLGILARPNVATEEHSDKRSGAKVSKKGQEINAQSYVLAAQGQPDGISQEINDTVPPLKGHVSSQGISLEIDGLSGIGAQFNDQAISQEIKDTALPFKGHASSRGIQLGTPALFLGNKRWRHPDVFSIQDHQNSAMSCGLKAKFTVSTTNKKKESIFTIGGFVMVEGCVVGLTTAHGIISLLKEFGSRSNSFNCSSEADDSTDGETTTSASASESSSPVATSGYTPSPHISLTKSEISFRPEYNSPGQSDTRILQEDKWLFLGAPKTLAYRAPASSDFALVDMEYMGNLTNMYYDPTTSSVHEISGHVSVDQVPRGEVLIISSSNDHPLRGYLLDDTASVILRGVVMRTRKIQLTMDHGQKPAHLSPPHLSDYHIGSGISGAWVVHQGKLCGCVFAAYTHGRYLHMLPIDDVFRNITQFSEASSVRVASAEDLATVNKSSREIYDPNRRSTWASGYESGAIPMGYNLAQKGEPQPPQPPTHHKFNYIRFQTATGFNGKRRAQQQYNLVVELYAEIIPVGSRESQWIKIAQRLSHPLVVRGQSPGHYKDGRPDLSASMNLDAEGGSYAGGTKVFSRGL
ncbi:uncharacterized protein TRUGW13939_06021 [Talaromyces rugulosus]|uniref:NDT80 domain-containing protein n=1 Tax=Talaromyces rugulosus TaxID=121627 RepID=A0A7H8R216_TALRU|nr:uncharacterized protein TRUGW13939_06021 [Talaromyces rugulosus]QKX58893.1 hypothetical protein TRUGW13939_06021 [Talaromyces rugulosus]